MFHVKHCKNAKNKGNVMNFEMFFKNCKELFALNGLLEPNEAQAIKLHTLTEVMLETNKVMNLTAIKEEKAIIVRHYVDSVLISEFIPKNATVLDVGCGAGFPTLPLAIFRPDIKITALDSTEKRINYVQETAKKLGLENVTAVAARAEDAAHQAEFRERFDIATARAVASLPVLAELCLPMVRIGGRFIAMKGSKAEEEITLAVNAIRTCGGKIDSLVTPKLQMPDQPSEERYQILINKLSATPQNYPRHFSKISKKPL